MSSRHAACCYAARLWRAKVVAGGVSLAKVVGQRRAAAAGVTAAAPYSCKCTMPACVVLHRMRHGGQERVGAIMLQQHPC